MPQSAQVFDSPDLHAEFCLHIFFIPLILYEYWGDPEFNIMKKTSHTWNFLKP